MSTTAVNVDSDDLMYDDNQVHLSPQRTQVDVLLVVAQSPHLRGFAEALGEHFDAMIEGRRVSAKTVGIGPVAAAASTAKRVFALQPRAVVHIGTACAYSDHDGFAPNSLAIPKQVIFADHGVVAGVSRFPEPVATTEETSKELRQGLLGCSAAPAEAVTVASPASDTATQEMAQRIRTDTGALLENLEAFAIRYACGLAETPYASVLSVSEVVGPDRAQHRTQFERPATFAAAELVLEWLHTGAAGLPERRPA